MRDPLRNVSVRYKLALTFLVVCLLSFGVGGALVSRSARESLEREVHARLRFQSESYATVLENDLRALHERARDFASDGYIRTLFSETAGKDRDDALRRHLRENKLPLEPAFRNLALIDASGEVSLLADPEDAGWLLGLPRALLERDGSSGLLRPDDREGAPSVVLSAQLRNLAGERPIGTLLARVHCGVWIAEALGSVEAGATRREPGFALQLVDREGRRLQVPEAYLGETVPPIASHIVRSGLGLRVRETGPEPVRAPVRGVLAQSFKLGEEGWSLETSLETSEAFAPVAGLQSRLLLVGVALTAAASLFLLFPMRFIAGPIRRLRDAATNMRGGDFSVRVPVESTDEVGELSHSFNLMAQAVEEHAEKLVASAHALSRERDRLNAVIHSMRDGLIVLDAAGRPEVWNQSAEPLRRVAASGGLEVSAHRNCLRADTGSDGASESAGHPCLTCLFEPAAPPRSCLVDVNRSVYEIHSTPLSPEADGRAGRVLVARDVTDRVAKDEQEIHQERLAVLGEIAAVMAHELNNPLAAIQMFAQMARSKLPAGSPLLEDIQVIERNTHTCTRTIRELLDYATGATPDVGPVDVHESLRDVASFLRAFRERNDSELVLELEAEDAVVVGDEVQLRQVFVNLVLNAIQAAEEGRVTVRTRLESRHLVVDVQDDGPGISDEVGDAIFKPFFTTKPRGSGTGLGLPTARRITEIQGGGLELVDRRPGHTTFRARLLRGKA